MGDDGTGTCGTAVGGGSIGVVGGRGPTPGSCSGRGVGNGGLRANPASPAFAGAGNPDPSAREGFASSAGPRFAGAAYGGADTPTPPWPPPAAPAERDAPMFATDEELEERSGPEMKRRRRGGAGSARTGRIEPVIDISDVDPIR